MPLYLKKEQKAQLMLLKERTPEDVIDLCKSAFDYLNFGPNNQRYELLSKKYNTNANRVLLAVEALIALLIDATKARADEDAMQRLNMDVGFSEDVLDILTQFVTSKQNFIEGSIKTANIRAYRLVNMEWRLEVRVASRCLLRQNNIFVTMKLYLHTEPKNENRDLLEEEREEIIHEDERRNRKDLLVQTDLCNLVHMIKTLEEALLESKTRRIRNIVNAIH